MHLCSLVPLYRHTDTHIHTHTHMASRLPEPSVHGLDFFHHGTLRASEFFHYSLGLYKTNLEAICALKGKVQNLYSNTFIILYYRPKTSQFSLDSREGQTNPLWKSIKNLQSSLIDYRVNERIPWHCTEYKNLFIFGNIQLL